MSDKAQEQDINRTGKVRLVDEPELDREQAAPKKPTADPPADSVTGRITVISEDKDTSAAGDDDRPTSSSSQPS